MSGKGQLPDLLPNYAFCIIKRIGRFCFFFGKWALVVLSGYRRDRAGLVYSRKEYFFHVSGFTAEDLGGSL